MEPVTPSSTPQPTPPLFNGPFTNPMATATVGTPGPATPVIPPKNNAKSPLFIIVLIIAMLELLVILGLLAALANGPQVTNKLNSKDNASNGSLEPQPATSVSVQQTNDAISSDISGLSNDRDIPVGRYDDKVLGL